MSLIPRKYLEFYLPDAILDDPSVGREFTGHRGIRQYFESYFIGYKTQTRVVKLVTKGTDHAHVEVDFRGEFPGGQIGGTFDLVFKGGKISFIKTDLLH